MNIFKQLLPILTLSYIAFSCKKKIPEGKFIQASGIVFDSVKNKVLQNAKVYLFGGNYSFYGFSLGSIPLDSCISDSHGSFSIKYIADGMFADYALTLSVHGYGLYTYPTAVVVPDYKNLYYRFNSVTQLANVRISARELDVVNVRIKVVSNPYDTLYAELLSDHYEVANHVFLTGHSFDTTIAAYNLPNAYHTMRYLILAKTASDSGFTRREEDSIYFNLSSPNTINKIINSTYDIPLFH